MLEPLRILLIDDNPDDRALVIRALNREFADVQVEQIIEEQGLLRALDVGDFDLAITDYRIRWTDGLTVLQAIKTRYPNKPVIMFTGTGSEEVAVEAMKSGLDDYVIKSPRHYARLPVSVKSIMAQVRQRLALQKAQSRYRALFDDVPLGLYRATPEGKVLDANPTLVKMLGYPSLAALQAINIVETYVDPKDRERWQNLLEKQGTLHHFRVQLRRRDGTVIWADDRARVVRDADGRVLYYEGSLDDITEQVRLSEKAAEVEVLRELDRLRSELIANVSHELRTPLGLIRLFCSTLLRIDLDPEAEREFLHDIEEEAEKLEKIVENLLNLSRMKDGRLPLDKRPTDIAQLIRDVVATMRAQLDRHQLSLDLPAGSLMARVDAKRIEQVLRNLLSNAIKYSPEGGVIRVRGRVDRGQLCIRVSDQGIGIPPDSLDKVFERFYRVENEVVEAIGGAGLGLSVCRGIIEAHGGRIWAESILGEGSTFSFQLPLSDGLQE